MIKYFISAMLVMGPFAAGARTVTLDSELQAYKDAVLEKLVPYPNTQCMTEGKQTYQLKGLIQQAVQVEVSETSAQPLLKFSYFSVGDQLLFEVQIFTDRNHLDVGAVWVRAYIQTRVNSGTLKDPVMADGYVLVPGYNADCVLR